MKILIDTNVLISAFVFGGKIKSLLQELLDSPHEIFISTYILEEFEEKISEKWENQKEDIMERFNRINFDIKESASFVESLMRDVKDDPILADARHYEVDILLSGDKDFLESGIKNPKIYSPKMLYEHLHSNVK